MLRQTSSPERGRRSEVTTLGHSASCLLASRCTTSLPSLSEAAVPSIGRGRAVDHQQMTRLTALGVKRSTQWCQPQLAVPTGFEPVSPP
jgi:hypothetical protein